mgnify:CR=1 FL=1
MRYRVIKNENNTYTAQCKSWLFGKWEYMIKTKNHVWTDKLFHQEWNNKDDAEYVIEFYKDQYYGH